MKITAKVICLSSLTACLIAPAISMADQLPKSGTVSGVFSWYVSSGGDVLPDKDHVIWGGISTGAIRNDAGSGFLHGTLQKCTFSGEFNNGMVTHNNGDCVSIDKDGDKVYSAWKCTACPEKGEFVYTGGTGKYEGIKGRGTYGETAVGTPVAAGWSVFKAEWTLP
jgi:hypothetical protein